MLPLRELGQLLVRHFELKEGLWDVAVEFQLAVGTLGPSPEQVLPGTMVGVSKVGLSRAGKVGPLTIDASQLSSE
jgi:hypothetical protein